MVLWCHNLRVSVSPHLVELVTRVEVGIPGEIIRDFLATDFFSTPDLNLAAAGRELPGETKVPHNLGAGGVEGDADIFWSGRTLICVGREGWVWDGVHVDHS